MIPSAVKTARMIFASILLLITICSASALIGAYVNTASGGESIPADTTGGAYTPLTGPEIVETAPGQIGTGTIIIAIPNGFEIDTSAAVAVIVTNLNGPDDPSKNINWVPNGTALPVLSINSTHIVFDVTAASASPAINSLLFVNISVRPTAGTYLGTGTIRLSGDSEITSVEPGYALGTLMEVPGAVATLVISPSHATINQSSSRSYSATGSDIYGNSVGVVTNSTTFSIDPLAGGSFAVNVYTAEKAGVWTVTGVHGSVNDTATLTVLDITLPIITMLGSSNVTIEVHTSYVDAGATALDDTDGNLTSSIITVNTVTPDVLGTYTVTYSVVDAAGNSAVEVRTVNVVDTTSPVITVLGANPVSIHYGDTYVDEGATANDNYDGNLTGALVTVINVNEHVLGAQTVTYDVTDSSGNTAHATRIVKVIDEEIPVITMLGSSPVNAPLDTVYADAGATALDNADGDITANITTTSNVNTSKVGTYTVTYRVSDSSGNVALPLTRTVNVVDVTPPVITVLGNSTVTVERTTPYIDAGATAMDNVDGDLTSSIVTVNPVNPNIVGTYPVTYNVSDAAGNTAQATRTVYVVDTTPPELTSAETQDADSDGKIDSIVLTFSEEIDDAELQLGTPDGWNVAGYDEEMIGTGTNTSDNRLVLTFNESSSDDTGATPEISYTQQSPLCTNDLAGNELLDLTVTATDRAPPIIRILGANPMTITTGSTFTDPGANATEPGLITTTGTVNTGAAGTYNITYQMTDDEGNDAANVTRTVNVVNPAGGGGGGGGSGGGSGYHPTTSSPAPSGGQPFTFPSLPLVTGNSEMQQQNPETVNIQPSGETAPEETGDLPVIQPQATGIFNLNTRMKWFGIGVLLLLLIALGTYAFRRMRKNSKPQFYP